MGTREITTWYCDRCHVEFPEKPKRADGSSRIQVSFFEHYDVGPGVWFKWDDMCAACSRDVEKTMKSMFEIAKGERRRNKL